MLRLILHAGPERLAIPAAAVAEVLPAVERHPTTGAVVVRGVVVPVLDLCRHVTGTDCPATLHARLVVLGGDRPLGLLAERVGDLVELPDAGGLTAGDRLGVQVAGPDGLVRLTDPARLAEGLT